MPRTLVTGGNIGDHVAEALAEKGISVRVVSRSVKPNQRWGDLGIEQVAVNFEDKNSLAAIFDGVERFFSATPLVENFVQLGNNAIEAAKRAGVHYIVRSSAMGASDTAISIGRWHREVEKTVENSGIPYTILQPNTFMQSYFMQAESIQRSNAFYMPQGEGKVSLVDVRDIAAVAVACLCAKGHEGEKHVLTGPEALSNGEIAQKLTSALGRKITYYDVTPDQAQESMAKAGMPAWQIQTLLELFEVSKRGWVAEVSPAVEEILKRKPISFDHFLAQNISAFRPDREVAGVA